MRLTPPPLPPSEVFAPPDQPVPASTGHTVERPGTGDKPLNVVISDEDKAAWAANPPKDFSDQAERDLHSRLQYETYLAEAPGPMYAGQPSDPTQYIPQDPVARAQWVKDLQADYTDNAKAVMKLYADANKSPMNPVNEVLDGTSAAAQNAIAATGLPSVASWFRDVYNTAAYEWSGDTAFMWGKGTIDQVDWSGNAEPSGVVGGLDASSYSELNGRLAHMAEIRQYLRAADEGGATLVNQLANENDLGALFGMVGNIANTGVGLGGGELGHTVAGAIQDTGLGGGGSATVVPESTTARDYLDARAPTREAAPAPAAPEPAPRPGVQDPVQPQPQPQQEGPTGTQRYTPTEQQEAASGGQKPQPQAQPEPEPQPEAPRVMTPEEIEAQQKAVDEDATNWMQDDAARAAQGQDPAFPQKATFLPREVEVPAGRESPGAPEDPNSPVSKPMTPEEMQSQQQANDAANRSAGSTGPKAGTAGSPTSESETQAYTPGQEAQAKAETSPNAGAQTQALPGNEAQTQTYTPGQEAQAKAETSPNAGAQTQALPGQGEGGATTIQDPSNQGATTIIEPGPGKSDPEGGAPPPDMGAGGARDDGGGVAPPPDPPAPRNWADEPPKTVDEVKQRYGLTEGDDGVSEKEIESRPPGEQVRIRQDLKTLFNQEMRAPEPVPEGEELNRQIADNQQALMDARSEGIDVDRIVQDIQERRAVDVSGNIDDQLAGDDSVHRLQVNEEMRASLQEARQQQLASGEVFEVRSNPDDPTRIGVLSARKGDTFLDANGNTVTADKDLPFRFNDAGLPDPYGYTEAPSPNPDHALTVEASIRGKAALLDPSIANTEEYRQLVNDTREAYDNGDLKDVMEHGVVRVDNRTDISLERVANRQEQAIVRAMIGRGTPEDQAIVDSIRSSGQQPPSNVDQAIRQRLANLVPPPAPDPFKNVDPKAETR
jgi:hypothetical protein